LVFYWFSIISSIKTPLLRLRFIIFINDLKGSIIIFVLGSPLDVIAFIWPMVNRYSQLALVGIKAKRSSFWISVKSSHLVLELLFRVLQFVICCIECLLLHSSFVKTKNPKNLHLTSPSNPSFSLQKNPK